MNLKEWLIGGTVVTALVMSVIAMNRGDGVNERIQQLEDEIGLQKEELKRLSERVTSMQQQRQQDLNNMNIAERLAQRPEPTPATPAPTYAPPQPPQYEAPPPPPHAYNPDFDSDFNQGFNPDFNQGFNPGQNQGFNNGPYGSSPYGQSPYDPYSKMPFPAFTPLPPNGEMPNELPYFQPDGSFDDFQVPFGNNNNGYP